MRSCTHRDLLFWSKSRWFACKNLRWGQGTIETSNSSAKVAVCMHKTTGEGWNPDCLYILVQSTLLCVLKTTDEVWDPHTLVSLVIKSLFCMKKTHRWGLRPIETGYSDARHAVFLVLITLFCTHKMTGGVWDQYRLVILVLITAYCLHKTTGDDWDQ